MNLETIAGQHNGCDILSNVMYVTLHGGNHHDRLRGSCLILQPGRGFISLFHIWLEDSHGIPHHLCGFYDLGQEHLALAEQVSDLLHCVHERALDYIHGFPQFPESFHHIFFQSLRAAFQNGARKPFFHCKILTVSILSTGLRHFLSRILLSHYL